jgi:hypothetical protein
VVFIGKQSTGAPHPVMYYYGFIDASRLPICITHFANRTLIELLFSLFCILFVLFFSFRAYFVDAFFLSLGEAPVDFLFPSEHIIHNLPYVAGNLPHFSQYFIAR